MKRDISAQDEIRMMYPESVNYKEFSRDVTFQVTERCNLSCFVAGTKILMSDYTLKNIEDVVIGDKVIGFTSEVAHGKHVFPEITVVTNTFARTDNVREIVSESGDSVICTDEHPFYSDRHDWRLAKNISSKTKLKMSTLGAIAVTDIQDKNYVLGYITAAWLGDGQLCYFKNGVEKSVKTFHNSRFVVKDTEITDRVCMYLDSLGIKYHKKPFALMNNVEACHVFGRCENAKLHQIIKDNFRKNNSPDYYKGFLAGIIDTEGNVSSSIRITNVNTDIINECCDALNCFDITYNVKEQKNSTDNFDKIYCVDVINNGRRNSNNLRFLINIFTAVGRKRYIPYSKRSTFKNITVKSNTVLNKMETVYNIETENHTYIANNFLVHNCTYCYQIAKTPKVMTWEVAKRIVDYLFELYDKDEEGAFITSHTKQIILDFIGGEPLLEIDLIDKICSYFWSTALKRQHEWADTFMVSMASNGTVYFNDEVQKFFEKFKHHLSFSVSIDGPEEMHDKCRVFPDGTGSFKLAKAAQDDFNRRFYNTVGTKATIARGNLPYLSNLIKYYAEQGFRQIHANCVYEEDWNVEDAKLLYSELKKTADYILEFPEELELSFFDENFFKPKKEDDLQTWCGGTSAMLAFDPDGTAYPCVRYMPTSLGKDVKPIIIGNCFEGIYNTAETEKILHELQSVDLRTQSTDECFYCPIAAGCSYCSAWNYQCFGTCNSRCTNICIMHKARALANSYFWNKYYKKHNIEKRFHNWLPDNEALKIITRDELDMLNSLEDYTKKMSNEIDFHYSYYNYENSIGQNDIEKSCHKHLCGKGVKYEGK